MDTLDAIHTRRSIRTYLDQPVSEELIQKLLAAAMQAPSARNQQPWQFMVIDGRALLAKIATFVPNVAMAGKAPLAILVCGDLSLEKSEGYWVVDCAAAVENMLLAAHALGLGAVSCGIYPREARMDGWGCASSSACRRTSSPIASSCWATRPSRFPPRIGIGRSGYGGTTGDSPLPGVGIGLAGGAGRPCPFFRPPSETVIE